MVDICLKSIQLIDENCDLKLTLINCRFIKPFDENLLDNLIQTHNTFVTIEEGLLSGGFGRPDIELFF